MSKRILIVDDEADINIVLREILESNGFTVNSFDNPHEALESFKPHFYSDILSSLPNNCIIQKPVTNEDLLKIINEVIHCGLK